LAKWKAIGTQNQNLNIQNILSKIKDEGPKLAVVTHGGKKTWTYATNGGKHVEQWVKMLVVPVPTFDPREEK
jgi:hypothetical protein